VGAEATEGCNAGTVPALVAALHATGVQNPPLELSATAPCASQLPRGWRLGGRCPVSRCSATWAQGDRGPRLQRGHRAGAGGRAPCHGGAEPATRAQRHSPRCKPTTSKLKVWWALSSVEMLRDLGAEATEGCNAGTGSARVAALHATGVQNPPLELSATAPCASQPPRGWMWALSSVEVLRDLGAGRPGAEAATRAPCRRG